MLQRPFYVSSSFLKSVDMMIELYNTRTRKKEELRPLNDRKVGMYVCGPTVYDYPHIGNARSFVVFDMIRRYLEYRGFNVYYVTNFTDIDDKMIDRANQQGIEVSELAEKFITEYRQIADELNLKPANINPRATEHIQQMIEMIEKIIEHNKAYVIDGDVYFDVSEFQAYGQLSGVQLDELAAGARVGVDEKKQDPRDFALWKAEKPGEPSWDSPWGRGRPGWHMECSVMGKHYLGVPFDIHGGGQDLIFPHHENEIAQTSAAYDVDVPVKYWLHNGFLTINTEKMSKSEGNFFTAREVLDNFDNQAVRLFLMSGHYRQPLDYNTQALQQAEQSMGRFRNAADTIRGRISILERKGLGHGDSDDILRTAIEVVRQNFEREMDDDFNSPGAFAALYSFVREINTHSSEAESPAVLRESLATLTELLAVLGLDIERTTDTQSDASQKMLKEAVELLLELRERAREEKDYATADMIRERLGGAGISISDTKDGPTWKIE